MWIRWTILVQTEVKRAEGVVQAVEVIEMDEFTQAGDLPQLPELEQTEKFTEVGYKITLMHNYPTYFHSIHSMFIRFDSTYSHDLYF